MIILKGVKLFDGERLREGLYDLLIEGRIVKRIVPTGNMNMFEGAKVIDLSGKIACPGFIDIHVHLREPGGEWREEIKSGALAGAYGGFTTIVAMPNTNPPIDSPELVRFVKLTGERAKGAKVLPAGSVSKGREGKELTEMARMVKEGAVLFTEDGSPTVRTDLLRSAMLYAKDLGVRIMEHPEDPYLSENGQINEGKVSAISGLKGIPATSELIDVERCIALSRELDVPIHITHVSTALAIRAIRKAKEEGVKVTCDVTPHHLTLDESKILESGYDSVYKVRPPLRSLEDVEALWDALRNGVIDAIATDHAPYHIDEKDLPFEEAPSGIASLECAVAVVLDAWEKRNRPVSLDRLLRLFTSGPSRVLPESYRSLGYLREGGFADITVIDLDKVSRVDVSTWKSKARLTPWNGLSLKGWPILTMVEGEIINDI
ncbi:MAG: dihydroorotase [Synergistetes bacterium]|nr:dihydroorotase [Synergistota bacterium]MDW8192888.1 dihydroorotase [Synergistota bacterium]